MTVASPPELLADLLRRALTIAEEQGFGLVACHIDHALALAEDVGLSGQIVRPNTTSVM